ncbi:LOB domain-containing protein 36-like protein [Tanacetum coccineum]
MSSSSNSPCAACRYLHRKCTQACVFATYFPPDQRAKFENVHKVFGAGRVANILDTLSTSHQRQDAVNALAFEADARLKDPVYGSAGLIRVLQHSLNQAQLDLHIANQKLATLTQAQYASMPPLLGGPMGEIGQSAMMPQAQYASMPPLLGGPMGEIGQSAMMPQAQYASMPPLLGGPMGEIGQVGGPSNLLLGPQQQHQQHHYYEAQLVDVSDEGGFAPPASVNQVFIPIFLHSF